LSRERSLLAKAIEWIGNNVSRAQHHVVQKNPFFPDLLNQPKFLIVPKLGRLVAIYIFSQRGRISWRDVFAWLEDLFEIKLATGDSTIVLASILRSEPLSHQENQFIALLRNFYDGFGVHQGFDDTSLEKIMSEVVNARPRENLFGLWHMERNRVAINLRDFNEEKFSIFLAESIPTRSKKDLAAEIESVIDREQLFQRIPHYRLRSPKEALAGLPEKNRLRFDLGLQLPTGETLPVELAFFGRTTSRNKVRHLMTKGRLSSYDVVEGNLVLRNPQMRPVLVIAGRIAGPVHDPFRYIRALASVGWQLQPAGSHFRRFQ